MRPEVPQVEALIKCLDQSGDPPQHGGLDITEGVCIVLD